MYLTQNIPMEQLLYPELTEEEEKIRHFAKQICGGFSSDQHEGLTEGAFNISLAAMKPILEPTLGVQETGMANPDDVFPCVLAVLGSGFAYMEIQKDGSFQLTEGSVRGGRCFMGVAKLMTGAQTYDEYTALAGGGNPYNVHYNNADVALEAEDADNEAGGMYAQHSEIQESYLYIMGKAATKDKDNVFSGRRRSCSSADGSNRYMPGTTNVTPKDQL